MGAKIAERDSMGGIRAFLGPAGSGKTYALIAEIEKMASQTALSSGGCILAITFMHGARRRLELRLRHLRKKGVSLQCETIDSFCLRIVNRFRRYLGRTWPISVQVQSEEEAWSEGERESKASLSAVRRAAAEVLGYDCVGRVVGKSFPLVVVDEFQDCDGDLLEVVSRLAEVSTLLVAADEFQHLSSELTCPASEWLAAKNVAPVCLCGNQRTNVAKLTETASALRNGTIASQSIDMLLTAPGLAAWEISSRIAWNKISFGKSKVIISPVRPTSSKWLQGLLDSVSKELGKKKKVGPYPFRWEGSEQEEFASISADIAAKSSGTPTLSRTILSDLSHSQAHVVKTTADRGLRLLSLRGCDVIDLKEFLDMLGRASHNSFAFRREKDDARLAMSVHGAKNREFDYVFIAWPYEVRGNDLLKRKLLYNAVTRAREEAILFVQGGEKRLKTDAVLSLLLVGLRQNT